MKSLTAIRLLLLLLLAFQTVAPAAQTTISGEMQSSPDRAVIIMYWNDFSLIQDTLQLDKNNQFSKQYSFTEPIYVRIDANISTPFMLLFPGEDLHIKINDTTIQLSGTAAPYNNFLVQLFKKSDSLQQHTDQNTATKYALEQCDSFFSSFRHKQAEAIKNVTVQTFIFRYKFYPVLMRYNADFHKMDTLRSIVQGNPISDEDPDTWQYLDKVKYTEEANKYDFPYLNMMNNLVRILRFHAIGKDSTLIETDPYLIETDIIKNIFPLSPLRTTLLAYNLNYRIASYTEFPAQLGGVDDFINDFKNSSNDQFAYLPVLRKKYMEAKASFGSLKKGAAAPGFKLKNINNISVSLSDFKGKVVYLDIWASWCAPCLKEMPHIAALKEKYKNKNLEIISISIDTKIAAWQKKIKDMQLTGVHLIDDVGSEKSKIAKDYYLSGVPHFVLIDQKGEIALASAPRPSETSLLEKTIDNLLNRGAKSNIRNP